MYLVLWTATGLVLALGIPAAVVLLARGLWRRAVRTAPDAKIDALIGQGHVYRFCDYDASLRDAATRRRAEADERRAAAARIDSGSYDEAS